MTNREKLAVLIRLRDAAQDDEKTALRWATEMAEVVVKGDTRIRANIDRRLAAALNRIIPTPTKD